MIKSLKLASLRREMYNDGKVEPGGKAGVGGVKVGDHVTEINGSNTSEMYHTEALTTVKKAQYSLSLVLKRPEETEEQGHSIQSISIAPEESKTRVSLTIGTKSAPSSPRAKNKFNHYDSTDNAPKKSKNVPTGQAYMEKLVGSLNDLDDDDDQRMDDLPPADRERSKTLPKSYGKKRQDNANTTNGTYSQDDSSKSLPRSKSSSDNAGPSNKAPHWYKQMYKQIHTSMEGESHLSKLLSSDAKRGAFRKYDGATTAVNYSSMSPEERRKSFENNALPSAADAPRRLQGGGRSAATHQHRKSLPNIHAANFNFMSPANYQTPQSSTSNTSSSSVTMRVNAKPSNTENRKSINSEWYRALQKGGEIPESGLAAAKPKTTINISNRSQTDGPSPRKTVTSKSGQFQASQYLREKNNADTFVPKEPTTNTKYNAPVDFLELRKRELKNLELEKEREQIREARERERLEEEEKLRKQKENDRKAAQQLEPVLTSPVSKSAPAKEEKSPIQVSPPREEPELPKLPEFGRAKYSFHPQGPGELEFRKGDTVRIIQGIDDNWIEGEHNGNVGIFPVSYVELLYDTPPSTPKQKATTPKKETTPPKKEDKNNNKQKSFEYSPPPIDEWTPPSLDDWTPPPDEPQTNGYSSIEEPAIQATQHNVVHAAPEPEPEPEPEPVREEAPPMQDYNIQEGLGKAKYTFKAETENELSFKKGDMITILKQVDENWYEGEFNDQIGIFPSNYIEVIQEPMVVQLEPVTDKKKKSEPAQGDIDFEQIFHDVLSEPVSPKSKQQQQQQSTKPSSYEEQMNHANDARNHNGYHDEYEPEPKSELDDLIGKGEPHRAVYTYKPTNEDEVELKVGDIVYVLEKCDDGWYIGTSQRTGVFGTFPGNYVTVA